MTARRRLDRGSMAIERFRTASEFDHCPFGQIADGQKSLACLMATTALLAAGARAYRMVSWKVCESVEHAWEAAWV
jgi:hypothetical protein